MKEKIIEYGLYGEKNIAFLPDFVHCELIETRNRSNDWEKKPHIHTNLCQLLWVESGKVVAQIDEKQLPLPVPCMLIIPENTVHGFDFSQDTVGKVITISSSFLDNLFQSSTSVLAALRRVQVIPLHAIKPKSATALQAVFMRLHEELYELLPERSITMKACFALIFVEIFRFADEQANLTTTDNQNLKHFRAFQRSIRLSASPQKNISKYAQELNITPVHLNRICKIVEKKSASQVVQAHFIREAERYLKYTTYSIAEISYLLHFEDPCYFSRLFKKQVGMSPKVFRGKEK
jgi:AraC family transcriptional regulator, transcriptional activator of pobA